MTYALFLSLLHALAVGATSVRVFLREDVSGPARLAWVFVVVLLPLAGVIIYMLLGEVYLPERLRQRHRDAFDALRTARPDLFADPAALPGLPDHVQAPFRISQSINGFAVTAENRARLLPDADAVLARMIADIDAARDSVHVLSYIWLTDTTGTAIANALMRASARGVTCRAAADHLGSRRLIRSPLWAQMAAAGVQLQAVLPLSRFLGLNLITRADLRNHRKLTVIDGCIGYIGSKNAADPGFAPKAAFGPWIDIMLRVEGPVVNQVQALFASDWMLQSDDTPADFTFAGAPVPGGFAAQYHGTGPLERRQSATHVFCTLFEMARHELIITTPYFVPDATVLSALQSAAWRGVSVTLILPRRNDSWIVRAASRGMYRALLEAGVQIREHGPGLLHAKTATVDGETSLLGSSNLDLRSFDLNFESDLLLFDPGLTGQIRARQHSYLAQSVPVTLQDMTSESALVRLRDNVIATIGPVL